MSGGPDSPGNRPPANSPGSVAEPGTSPGPGCTCQARIFWETNLGGPRSPGGPALPLSRMAGASALAPAGQEDPQEKTCSGRKPGRRMPRKIWRGRLSRFARLRSLGWGQRPPSSWAVVGALAVGLLACLFMLFSIQAHLESLREDLAALRRERLCQASGTPEEERDAPNSRQVGEEGARRKASRSPQPLGGWGAPDTHPHSLGAILEGNVQRGIRKALPLPPPPADRMASPPIIPSRSGNRWESESSRQENSEPGLSPE